MSKLTYILQNDSKMPLRSRSSSPVVKKETKSEVKQGDDQGQVDPGEILVLDSDDEEAKMARARMEARMRAQIEYRRLEGTGLLLLSEKFRKISEFLEIFRIVFF